MYFASKLWASREGEQADLPSIALPHCMTCADEGTRPVIDLQSFRAAITAQIEKVAKDHQHRFEVPLSEVVNYAGIGAARAARQWNGICHKE